MRLFITFKCDISADGLSHSCSGIPMSTLTPLFTRPRSA